MKMHIQFPYIQSPLAIPRSCPFVHAPELCVQCNNTQLNVTSLSKCSHPRPIQNSEQIIILHMGIIPIPPPPRPPRNPPRLAGPPPMPLPLLLPLVDLLFATPVEAWPLPVLPDAFLFFFHAPRALPRPLLPPRLFELSWDCARVAERAGAN